MGVQSEATTDSQYLVKKRAKGDSMALNKSRCARFVLLRVCALAALITGSFAAAYAQSSDETVRFDLPAQSLEQALKDFGVSADKQLLFATDLAEGKMVAGLSGEMEPMAALDELLDGTGLVYETTSSNVILVKIADVDEGGDRDPKTLHPKSILMAQNQTTVPRRDQSLAESSGNDRADADAGIIPLEEIIVTGTNIRGVENPTVPVIQFDREDIEVSGALTVEDFVRTIPQNFASTSPFAADSANNFTAPDNATSGSAIDLRGLGTGTTLTLLNGRRMTPTGFGSFVDISLLPLNAIKRIDVLTDGASAVYGTDAVGGVVNFITRKDYEGFDISSRYGTVTDGAREEYSLGASGGLAWEAGGFFGGVEYTNQEPLLIGEREFFDQTSLDPDQPFGPKADRISAIVGLNEELTDRISVGVDALYSNRESSGFNSTFTQSEFENEQDALFTNSRIDFKLTDGITATAFYDYSREDAESVQALTGTSEYTNELNLLEAQLSGELFRMSSGESLSFAVGGLYREESFELEREGISIVDSERDVSAVYGEVLLPLVGEQNSFGLIDRIDVSIAGRYEDFSDFGSTFNPKFGVRTVVANDLEVRVSYSEAFRAPTLQEIELPLNLVVNPLPNAFITTFTPPPPDDPALTGFTVLLATSGGNADLQEETAEVWSIGSTYTPSFASGLSLDVTYYAISYDDRLEVIAPLTPLQNPAFVDLAVVNPGVAFVSRLFDEAAASGGFVFNFAGFDAEDVQVVSRAGLQNVGVREVDGIDANISYEFDTGMGTLFSHLNIAYVLNFDSQLSDASEALDELNALYRPLELRLRGGIGWKRDSISIVGIVNYSGSYDDNVDRAEAGNVDAWTTFDMNTSYQFGDQTSSRLLNNIRLSLNVRNLFDEEPPTVLTADGFNYDTVNADPFGRFISIGVAKEF